MNALIISGIISCIIAVIIIGIIDNIDSAKQQHSRVMYGIIFSGWLAGVGLMLFFAGIIVAIISAING